MESRHLKQRLNCRASTFTPVYIILFVFTVILDKKVSFWNVNLVSTVISLLSSSFQLDNLPGLAGLDGL